LLLVVVSGFYLSRLERAVSTVNLIVSHTKNHKMNIKGSEDSHCAQACPVEIIHSRVVSSERKAEASENEAEASGIEAEESACEAETSICDNNKIIYAEVCDVIVETVNHGQQHPPPLTAKAMSAAANPTPWKDSEAKGLLMGACSIANNLISCLSTRCRYRWRLAAGGCGGQSSGFVVGGFALSNR
jgi:hypothetical protein